MIIITTFYIGAFYLKLKSLFLIALFTCYSSSSLSIDCEEDDVKDEDDDVPNSKSLIN